MHIPKVRYILKPLIAGIIMGVAVYFINMGLNMIISANISTILSILAGAIIYVILIFVLKILTKEEIMMIPFGSKLLEKLNMN